MIGIGRETNSGLISSRPFRSVHDYCATFLRLTRLLHDLFTTNTIFPPDQFEHITTGTTSHVSKVSTISTAIRSQHDLIRWYSDLITTFYDKSDHAIIEKGIGAFLVVLCFWYRPTVFPIFEENSTVQTHQQFECHHFLRLVVDKGLKNFPYKYTSGVHSHHSLLYSNGLLMNSWRLNCYCYRTAAKNTYSWSVLRKIQTR